MDSNIHVSYIVIIQIAGNIYKQILKPSMCESDFDEVFEIAISSCANYIPFFVEEELQLSMAEVVYFIFMPMLIFRSSNTQRYHLVKRSRACVMGTTN